MAGRNALIAEAGALELERGGRQAELQVGVAVELGADVLQILLEVPERERHGRNPMRALVRELGPTPRSGIGTDDEVDSVPCSASAPRPPISPSPTRTATTSPSPTSAARRWSSTSTRAPTRRAARRRRA